jgi:hypothetical protein
MRRWKVAGALPPGLQMLAGDRGSYGGQKCFIAGVAYRAGEFPVTIITDLSQSHGFYESTSPLTITVSVEAP